MSELLRWQVGDVRITRVQELEAPDIRFVMPDATVENLAEIAWLGPFRAPGGHALASVHTLILEVGERRIAVDTCIGNDKLRPIPAWNMLQLPFLEDLDKAGYPRGSDRHRDLHASPHRSRRLEHAARRRALGAHVPNARYVLARREWEHWSAEPDQWNQTILADSVRPIFDAGLVDLVEADHAVEASVRLEPTPGHTPGHVSVHVARAARRRSSRATSSTTPRSSRGRTGVRRWTGTARWPTARAARSWSAMRIRPCS